MILKNQILLLSNPHCHTDLLYRVYHGVLYIINVQTSNLCDTLIQPIC